MDNKGYKITYFYILIDPETYKVRYVGKANNIHRRFIAHKSTSHYRKYHSAIWIKGLLSKGLEPIIKIIENFKYKNKYEWGNRESYWIRCYRKLGFDLTNFTIGGEGGTTYGRLGKKNSPEHIAKTRAGRIGKPVKRSAVSNEKRANGIRAYHAKCKEVGIKIKRQPHSEETKIKISNANKGKRKMFSEETRQKLRENIRKVSDLTKKPVLAINKKTGMQIFYPSVASASRSLNISHTGISNALNGRTKSSGGYYWKYTEIT